MWKPHPSLLQPFWGIFILGVVTLRRKRWKDARTLSPFERTSQGAGEAPRGIAGSTLVGMMNYSMATWLTINADEIWIHGALFREPLVAQRNDIAQIIIRTRLGRRRIEFRDRDNRDSYVVFLTFDAGVEEQLSSLAWPVETSGGSQGRR